MDEKKYRLRSTGEEVEAYNFSLGQEDKRGEPLYDGFDFDHASQYSCPYLMTGDGKKRYLGKTYHRFVVIRNDGAKTAHSRENFYNNHEEVKND